MNVFPNHVENSFILRGYSRSGKKQTGKERKQRTDHDKESLLPSSYSIVIEG